MVLRIGRKPANFGAFRVFEKAVLPLFLAASLVCGLWPASFGAAAAEPNDLRPMAQRPAELRGKNADFELFLDRLMMAESGGRDFLKNPRSTALGPFQFIKGTFLYVVRRHFADRVVGKTTAEILALRTNRAFAREVIAEYSRELASHLATHGIATTYGNLRLAYLLGPTGATRVLTAKADKPLRRIISRAAIAANPFLSRMSAQDIIARAHRDISMDRSKRLAVTKQRSNRRSQRQAAPRIKVRCNLARPSCRRWLALRKKKLRKEMARKVVRADRS